MEESFGPLVWIVAGIGMIVCISFAYLHIKVRKGPYEIAGRYFYYRPVFAAAAFISWAITIGIFAIAITLHVESQYHPLTLLAFFFLIAGGVLKEIGGRPSK